MTPAAEKHIRPKIRTRESIRKDIEEQRATLLQPSTSVLETDPATGTVGPSDEDTSDEDKPLVIGSLAELIQRAGHSLPKNEDLNQPGNVVEADFSFQCVSQEEYSTMQQDVFLGTQMDPFGEENDDNSEADGVLGFFGAGDDESSEGEPREPTLFYKLWTLLAHWMTPQAAEYASTLRGLSATNERVPAQYTVHENDIVASRCSGLVAMLKMHLSRAITELDIDSIRTREVEEKMTDLLRCFQYNRPMPLKLDIKTTRALTCVLVATVTNHQTELIPECCKSLGMEWDEYRYITQTCFTVFQSNA